MQGVRIIETTATQWGVPHAVLGVLHAPGAECTSGQTPGFGAYGCDRAISGKSWPGCRIGVRPPSIDETPLSDAEVIHGMTRCLL